MPEESQSSTKWTIYCHTHTDSGRRYIGVTRYTWQKRWSQHQVQAKKRTSGWSYFQEAIRQYGKEAFSHEALAQSWDFKGANATEKDCIAQYDTANPERGFTRTPGGDSHTRQNPWLVPGYREKIVAVNTRERIGPKTCRCGSLGPFRKKRTKKDGLSSVCKACEKKTKENWKKNNKSSYLAAGRSYMKKKRADRTPEQVIEDNKKAVKRTALWRVKNPGRRTS